MKKIPKTIHYCWFGNGLLTEQAKKCIDSWKQHCPDYDIVLWNEQNFDYKVCNYVEEAYKAQKWAFVSDYARFWILYNNGGIYFDTDVEMIKGIDDLVLSGGFMGFEADGRMNVAPGLGVAAYKGDEICKKILDYYDSIHFIDGDGNQDLTPVGEHITQLLLLQGLEKENRIQRIKDIFIYPTDFFCPKDVRTGKISITENTRTIHHYSASWLTNIERYYRRIESRFEGKRGIAYKLIRIYTAPLRLINKIKINGIRNAICYIPRYFKCKG